MPKQKLSKLVPKREMTVERAGTEKGSIASAAQGLIALGMALIGASAVVGNIAYQTLAVGVGLLLLGVSLNIIRERMKGGRWKNPLAPPDNDDIDDAAEDE